MNKLLLTGLAIAWRVDYDDKGEAKGKHKADPEYNGCGKYHMFAEAFNDGQLELTYRPFSASGFESSYNEDGSHNENY